MERTKERLAVARRALGTLEELVEANQRLRLCGMRPSSASNILSKPPGKAAQVYLREIEGLEAGSPKGAVRLSLQVGILGEEEARSALAMVDDRNLTVHTYNEAIAEAISQRLGGYASLMSRWIAVMIERLGEL